MDNVQLIEAEIQKLPTDTQYLVRECAHELEQVLKRYGHPVPLLLLPSCLALDLVAAKRLDLIRY